MTTMDRTRTSLSVLRANTVPFERPDRLTRAVMAARPYGTGALAAFAASTARYPKVAAIIADDEQVTYRDLWCRSAALADELSRRGIDSTSRIAILCRNSPWFVYSLIGASMVGADIVLLNTSFGPTQAQDTVASEGVDLLFHDDEFVTVVGDTPALSVSEMRNVVGGATGRARPRPPKRASRLIVLTSGTTGKPKGAGRPSEGPATQAAGSLLATIPVRARDTLVIPAPFFHGWGLAGLLVGLGLSATVVTSAHFDPADVLRLVDAHRADGLVVVPTMLHRICALPPRDLARFETRSLRLIASSGSAIPGPLATEVLDRFGPVLYNMYGSTEVATATIARPRDLRRAPTTAGRPAVGVRVAILDDAGTPVPQGVTGRIFVGNAARFDGYTGGGGKETIDGLLSTGDLGHFDAYGMLFVDGRDDDMIVSGGENVYPSEIEDVLNRHPDVSEAVVVGIDDETFGRALKAVVVPKQARTLAAEELKAYVSETLARYKVPRSFVFVDELPRTATGKVLRRELA